MMQEKSVKNNQEMDVKRILQKQKKTNGKKK